MNSKNVSEPTGEQMTLFSPVGSLNHANHTALQENDLEKKMTATSGRKCLDVFEKFNRVGLWAKTFSALLIGQGDWFSTKCNLTWKLKATKYKRMYFQLAPSTPRTGGIGFGLLPTIRANQVNGCNLNSENLANRNKGNIEETVAKWVTGLLPTPQAIDGNGHGRDLRLKKDCNRDPEQPGSWRGDLKDFAVKGLLPTPTAHDFRSTHAENSQAYQNRMQHHRGVPLVEHMQREMDGKSFQLNPPFVAEMMGFPPDWTELPFLNGETKALKHTGTL